jgi:prepilin-type N-terminal cleavage/methylation domain-containing protein
MKNTQKQHGFTLIELLVVIAIIALLAGLLFPAISAALTTAKKAKAKQQAQTIESAIMLYFNEYNGRLPVATYGTDDNEITEVTANGTSANEIFSKKVLIVLMSIDDNDPTNNINHKLNPKKIVFLETDVPSDDGKFLDPWGSQYQIILDSNLDGSIVYLTNSNENHRKKAVVVSAGKNRKFGSSISKDTSGGKYNTDNVANVDLPRLN